MGYSILTKLALSLWSLLWPYGVANQNLTLLGVGSPQSASATVTWTNKTCANQNNATGVTSVSCTWSANPASGETVVCHVMRYDNTSGGLAVTDSNSDTYTAIGSEQNWTDAAGGWVQNFYFRLSTSITTSTFNITSGTGNFLFLACSSATGIAASSPLDTNGGFGQVTNGGTVTSGSFTTTVNGDGIFCGAMSNSTYTGAGTGFTLGSSFNSGQGITEYLVQGTAGATTGTAPLTATAGEIVCSAFKP